MAQTLRALFERVDVLPMADGLAAVFNAETADARRYFEVIRVAVRPPSGQAGQSAGFGLAAKMGLYRTTASSGGTAIVPVKRDTGSANLPAGVTCTYFPDSVTVSGAPLRTIADAPSLTIAAANSWLGARVYGGSFYPYQRGNAGDLVRLSGDANVQRIVLREGEGLAVVLDAAGQPRAGQINLTVRNESSGATYQFRSRDIGTPRTVGQAVVSLFNGTGSGVVLGVSASEFPNDGEANMPGMRLALIEGLSGGDDVTPVAHSTGAAAPAALVCRASDFVAALAGSGAGVAHDWNSTHGQTFSVYYQQRAGAVRYASGMPSMLAPGLSPGIMPGDEQYLLFAARAGSGIVLRPGMGLALLAGRSGALETSTFLYLDVEMTVLHYPPPSAGTFPAVGDVESGVVYGPTDNLTGTLVVPAAGDVRLGTGFGANGTEFTGTLAGGGGSGGTVYLRRGR